MAAASRGALPPYKERKAMPYLALSLLLVVLDQWCKTAVTAALGSVGASAPFLPGILRLTLVHNYGASWGILSGQTTLLLVVTGLVCLALLLALLLGKPASWLGRLSLAFILGGAVGNALDRFLQGYVTDMFDTVFMNFPVFNLADCCITLGAAFLILWVLTDEKKARAKQKESSRKRWEQSRDRARADAALTEETRREFRREEEHDDVSDR